jgi:NAD(P) transhydrogenase
VVTHLASGKLLPSDTLLYATGRQGATAGLGLDRIGIEPDKRGRVAIDESFRTKVPHIYAVGDVAGPPGLAATAMEQGRIATMHAFGQSIRSLPELIPTGIYSIPEISFVGRTEKDLTEAAVPYVSGVARWSELAKGLMTRETDGLLKLLVSTEDRSILGVHVIGSGATDLVHIGQAVMGGDGGIDFLLTAVFNYPTFAESYKVAALDAMNRINLAA